MSDNVRPSEDISTLLPGGPSAWEASDELVMVTATLSTPPPALTWPTRASGSRVPNGLTPLNSFWARPSQKLRLLKTALITDGALRPVVRRTLTAPTWKSVSSPSSVWPSSASPSSTPVKCEGRTPCEPTTLSELIGKSLAVSWAFGPLEAKLPPRGLSWFRERLSAPAS